MKELIKHILKEETIDLSQSLMRLFEKTLIKQNSDELCSISVKQLGKHYSVTLFIKIGVFTNVREKLMNDAWKMVYDVTGKSSAIYQKDCEKKDNIREEISKESKFEKLLNDHLSNIKKTCESEIGGTIVEIDLDACDQAEQTEKIKVVEAYSNKGSIILVLDFYVNTITDSMSIDELLWELQVVVQDILGKGRVKLVHNETINTRQNRQW
jgi:hypothetical protein